MVETISTDEEDGGEDGEKEGGRLEEDEGGGGGEAGRRGILEGLIRSMASVLAETVWGYFKTSQKAADTSSSLSTTSELTASAPPTLASTLFGGPRTVQHEAGFPIAVEEVSTSYLVHT